MVIKCTTLQFVFILFIGLTSCKPQNNAEYYFNKGVEYFDNEEYEKALDYYNKAISIKPNYLPFYVNRGLAKYSLEQNEEAMADYEKAYSLDSLDIRTNFLIATLLTDQDRDYESIEFYDRITRHYPHERRAHYSSGVARYWIGDYKGALEQFAKYIGYNVNSPWTYYYMGMCNKELGNIKTAIEAFEIAVELGNKEAKEELEKLKEQ